MSSSSSSSTFQSSSQSGLTLAVNEPKANPPVSPETPIQAPSNRFRHDEEHRERQKDQPRQTIAQMETSKWSDGSRLAGTNPSHRKMSSSPVFSHPADEDMDATTSSSSPSTSLLDMDIPGNVSTLLGRCDHPLHVKDNASQHNCASDVLVRSARHGKKGTHVSMERLTPAQLEIAKKLASNPPPPPPQPQRPSQRSDQPRQNQTVGSPSGNDMLHHSFTTNLTEAAKVALGRARSRKHLSRSPDSALPQLSNSAAAELAEADRDCSPGHESLDLSLTRDTIVGSRSSDSDIVSSYSSSALEGSSSISNRFREQKLQLRHNRSCGSSATAASASAETERDIRELQRQLLSASLNSASRGETNTSNSASGRSSALTIPTHDGPRRMLTLRSISRSSTVSDSSATMTNRSRSPASLGGGLDREDEATSSVVSTSDVSNTETFLSELEGAGRGGARRVKTSLRMRLQRKIRRNHKKKNGNYPGTFAKGDENQRPSGSNPGEEITRRTSSSSVEFSDDITGKDVRPSKTPGAHLKTTVTNRIFSFSDDENDVNNSSIANILLDLRRTAITSGPSTTGSQHDSDDDQRARSNTVISDGALEAKVQCLPLARHSASISLKGAETNPVVDNPAADAGSSSPDSQQKKMSPRKVRKSVRRLKSLPDKEMEPDMRRAHPQESGKLAGHEKEKEKDNTKDKTRKEKEDQPLPQQKCQIPRPMRKNAGSGPPNVQRTNQVQIHVYDLFASETYVEVLPWAGCEFPLGRCFSAMNTTLHALGTGAYHVGVEVNGIEYAFGANNIKGLSGVFTCHPKKSPGYGYRTSLDFGQRKTLRRTWISVPKVEQTLPPSNPSRKDTDNSEKSTDSSSDESADVQKDREQGVKTPLNAESKRDEMMKKKKGTTSSRTPNVATVYKEVEKFVDGRSIMREMAVEYMGVDYDLLKKNCCTFAYDACLRLGVAEHEIPTWFLNIAEAGAATEAAVARVETSVLSPIKNIISSHAAEHRSKAALGIGSGPPPKPQPQTGYEVIAKSTTKKGNVRRTELEIVHVVERSAGRGKGKNTAKARKKIPKNGAPPVAKENEEAPRIRESLSF